MSHQSVPARLNEKKAPGSSPSPPVQSSSGICIKQEYVEDQFPMTRIIKTESSESPPNEHNIMQSIKVEVKEEHYDDQDCVVKCELDFDEGEQIDRKIKVKVEDVSSGQPVQHFKCFKKEEEDGGEYVMQCDCGECEICRVKMEMKDEPDESGFETELGGNNVETVEGCTRVKKEEGEDDGEVEMPYKIRRMDRVVGNVATDQTVSPPPTVTHSIVHTNIKVEVDGASNGQSDQLCNGVKKEEDGGEYVMECDCNECLLCKMKMEMKDEPDESGFETELGGNNVETVQGCTRVKKEEGDDDGEVERPNKIRRMDGVVGNAQVGSPLPNVISINIEGLDGQMSSSSTNPTTIEDQPSQPVTIPTSIITPTQSSSSSTQHVNETLRNELLNAEPRTDNVTLVVEVGGEDFDREQVDEDNSTLNPVHIGQDDEEEEGDDQTIEYREDPSAGAASKQVQLTAENFVKQIEPDELGNRFECDYRGCAKRMKLRTNLICHIRSHTGEKLFNCTVAGCDRTFVKKVNLDEHLNIHSGSRPNVCIWPGCEARFASKANLTGHIRTHTGERPFKCEQCDATFNRHSNLVAHLRTHSGLRPIVCTWPDCGQAFNRSSHLKAHSTVHSNERQFACDVTGCTKVYKRKDVLRRHQKTKHN